jgi:hypothetical protein
MTFSYSCLQWRQAASAASSIISSGPQFSTWAGCLASEAPYIERCPFAGVIRIFMHLYFFVHVFSYHSAFFRFAITHFLFLNNVFLLHIFPPFAVSTSFFYSWIFLQNLTSDCIQFLGSLKYMMSGLSLMEAFILFPNTWKMWLFLFPTLLLSLLIMAYTNTHQVGPWLPP